MELGEVDRGAGRGAALAPVAEPGEGELPFASGVLERVGEVVGGAPQGVRGGIVVVGEPRVERRRRAGHVAGRELPAGRRQHGLHRVGRRCQARSRGSVGAHALS